MAKILNDLESATGPELSKNDYHLLAHLGHVFLLGVQTQVHVEKGKLEEGLEKAQDQLELMAAITEEWTQEDVLRILNVVESRAGLELTHRHERRGNDEDHS